MGKPDVDHISGLSPAISIEQKQASRSPRSTVGTVTEVYDYLRLLFARAGIPHCPICNREVTRQSAQEIVDAVEGLPEGARHVFVLHAVYGYSHDEAAAMLGIATGTSKAQLHRARKLLAQQLEEQGFEV